MSLKSFHIVFITAATALSLFLCLWGFYNYRESSAASDLIAGIAGAGGLVALIPYFRWFQKKMGKMALAFFVALSLSPFTARSAHACAVCFGDPDSSLSKGIKAGVVLLVLVVGGLLGAITTIGISWARRARTLTRNLNP